jgi:equilibrative nucleoside transporter 1/2/3
MPLSERFQVFRVKSLVSMSLLRTIFVPLFLVCNVVVSSERNLPVLVRNDFVYFLIVWIFAVSNGWIGSLCMMAAPQQKAIKSGKEKSMVGSVMSFSLVLGLAIGGLLSFPFRQLI